MFFITTICVYDFCETLLVEKSTPCQGMIWIFPSNMLYFYTGFLTVLRRKLTCEPWVRNAKKRKRRGCCPQAPAGACAPRTLRPSVLKKQPPCQLFFCCKYFPGSVLYQYWHWLLTVFKYVYIWTHILTCFWTMWHVCLTYCSSYALGSMSLRSLQIFSQEWGSVEMKNVAFWVKLHSFLNLWQCGVFSVTNVCVFCYQWCL